ncbi:MAG: VWA domain-containing protein, partial [Terriglobales bacterium]
PHITPFQAYLIMAVHDPVATRAAEAEQAHCQTGDLDPPVPILNNLWSDADPVHMQAEATWELARQASEATQAAIKDVVDYIAQEPGKRIVVLASGGFLSGTLESQQDAIIRDALRADVVINALDAKGLYGGGPGRPLSEASDAGTLPVATYFFEETSKLSRHSTEDAAMANLSESTGGLFFQNDNDLTLGFERLGLAPAAAYEIAFSPAPLIHDGKLHRLKVKLTPPIHGAEIEARRGYFAPPPGLTAGELEEQLDAAMRGTSEKNAVEVDIRVHGKPGGIAVTVNVNAAHLTFIRSQGRRGQKLTMLAGLFDPSGKFVSGERGELDLAFKDATYKLYCTRPLSPEFALSAPPGAYLLRVVVQELSDGKLSAHSLPVRIR